MRRLETKIQAEHMRVCGQMMERKEVTRSLVMLYFVTEHRKMAFLIVGCIWRTGKWFMLEQEQQELKLLPQKLGTGPIDILALKDFNFKNCIAHAIQFLLSRLIS